MNLAVSRPSITLDNTAIDCSACATREETCEDLSGTLLKRDLHDLPVSPRIAAESCSARDGFETAECVSQRSAEAPNRGLPRCARPLFPCPRRFGGVAAFRATAWQEANERKGRGVDDRVLGRWRDPIGLPRKLEGMLGRRKPHGDFHQVRRGLAHLRKQERLPSPRAWRTWKSVRLSPALVASCAAVSKCFSSALPSLARALSSSNPRWRHPPSRACQTSTVLPPRSGLSHPRPRRAIGADRSPEGPTGRPSPRRSAISRVRILRSFARVPAPASGEPYARAGGGTGVLPRARALATGPLRRLSSAPRFSAHRRESARVRATRWRRARLRFQLCLAESPASGRNRKDAWRAARSKLGPPECSQETSMRRRARQATGCRPC